MEDIVKKFVLVALILVSAALIVTVTAVTVGAEPMGPASADTLFLESYVTDGVSRGAEITTTKPFTVVVGIYNASRTAVPVQVGIPFSFPTLQWLSNGTETGTRDGTKELR